MYKKHTKESASKNMSKRSYPLGLCDIFVSPALWLVRGHFTRLMVGDRPGSSQTVPREALPGMDLSFTISSSINPRYTEHSRGIAENIQRTKNIRSSISAMNIQQGISRIWGRLTLKKKTIWLSISCRHFAIWYLGYYWIHVFGWQPHYEDNKGD